MQRPLTAIVGLAAVALAVWVVVHNLQLPKATGYPPVAPAGANLADAGGSTTLTPADASSMEGGGVSDPTELAATDVRLPPGNGATMPDGTPVPPLPFASPLQVRFGIVLVSFSGAQPSPGQPQSTRSRADAMALADKLLVAAQHDFHGAVQQGDPGSAEDIGRVRLGVLEPAPEYVLFTLPVGGVGGPVETPRGFWIVKRLE